MNPRAVRAGFDPESSNASLARRFVDGALSDWGCDDLADTAILLVGELVANVVLHARTAFEVSVGLDGRRLRVEVCDADARLPTRKHYSVTATTGRGLAMLDELADRWGASPTAGGKCVWFELENGAPGRRPAAVAFDDDDDDDDILSFHLDPVDDAPAGQPEFGTPVPGPRRSRRHLRSEHRYRTLTTNRP